MSVSLQVLSHMYCTAPFNCRRIVEGRDIRVWAVPDALLCLPGDGRTELMHASVAHGNGSKT